MSVAEMKFGTVTGSEPPADFSPKFRAGSNAPSLQDFVSDLQATSEREHLLQEPAYFALPNEIMRMNSFSEMPSTATELTATEIAVSGQSRDTACPAAARLKSAVLSEQDLQFSDEHICGSWAFVVLKAVWKGKQVAVKVQDVHGAKTEFEEEFLHASERARHPNVIDFMGTCSVDSMPALVYEYLEGGSVDFVLFSKRQELGKMAKPPLLLALSWCSQMFRALEFLHSFRSHRDVKLQNLVLTADLKVLKLGEFSNTFSGNQQDLKNNEGDSFRFAAPEVLANGEVTVSWEKADVYAATISMWAMLKGQVPFANVQDSRIVALMGAKGARPPPSDKKGVDSILQQGWNTEPQSRPPASKMADLVEAVLFREQNRGMLWKVIRAHSGKWA